MNIVNLHNKREFADVIKLKILRWGDYPGLSRWTLQERGRRVRVRERDTMVETEVREMWGHEARDVGNL